MDPQAAIWATQEIAKTWVEAFISNASNYALKIVGAIAAFILMMIVAGIVARLVKKMILRHSDNSDNKNNENAEKVAKLVRDLVYYILLWFAIFVAFEVLWFDVGLLLWWVSFGIWLAFKEILGNMIAWIMILYTKEFQMWDVIEVQSDESYFGRIEEITIRYTIIRTLDLRQVVIPNLKMISVPIKTFSAEDIVKLSTIVGVHYDTDIEKAIPIIVQAINNLDFVKQKENTTVFVTDFGDSAINLKAIFFFDPKSGIIGDYAIWVVNEAINTAFTANKIIIPYQHTTLQFASEADKEKWFNKVTPPTTRTDTVSAKT